MAELAAIMDLLPAYPGSRITVDLATSFGVHLRSKVPPERVLHYIERHAIWVSGVSPSVIPWDMEIPGSDRIVTSCRDSFPDTTFRCHFHNTRGLGLANTLAAFEAGIRSFDSSIGGLGGCPFAPAPRGMLPRRICVHVIRNGIETGVDLPRSGDGPLLPGNSSLCRIGECAFQGGLPAGTIMFMHLIIWGQISNLSPVFLYYS